MSRENVDVVRRWFWAFENDTEAFRDALHRQIEWYPIEEDNRPNLGIEAATRNRNEWLDTWDSHRFDWEVVAEEGENVVVLVHITAQGKASGVEVDVLTPVGVGSFFARNSSEWTRRVRGRPSL